MKKVACIFPGQGSQSVGMGKDLNDNFPAAQAVLAEIDRIAGRPLSRLSFEGPEAELKRTINTQPTILAVSIAAWQCYRELGGPEPAFVAGHSLGEFTALVAAEVLPVATAVRLVAKRAQLMEECPPGSMSAVLGVAPDLLEKVCAESSTGGEVVIVANFNTREQLVISGNPLAVERAGELARARGGKVIPLPVGGAFHSPIMVPAAEEFSRELKAYTFADARVAIVQNFDAGASTSASEIKDKLGRQMPNSVRWCETVEHMLSQGVDTFVEIGPGKALSGMVKKIDRAARIFNIYDTETLRSTVDALRQAAAVSW